MSAKGCVRQARYLLPMSNDGPLAYRIYSDTGHPFLRSSLIKGDSQLLPIEQSTVDLTLYFYACLKVCRGRISFNLPSACEMNVLPTALSRLIEIKRGPKYFLLVDTDNLIRERNRVTANVIP